MRRNCGMLASVAAFLGFVAAGAASAQSPLTADSLRTLRVEVMKTARQNDSLTRAWSAVQEKARLLITDLKAHNAEPCEYPPSQPELCAEYDNQRSFLNAQSIHLQRDMKGLDSTRKMLQARFSGMMTHLRAAAFAPAIETRRDEVVACSNLEGLKEAATCLTNVLLPARNRPA